MKRILAVGTVIGAGAIAVGMAWPTGQVATVARKAPVVAHRATTPAPAPVAPVVPVTAPVAVQTAPVSHPVAPVAAPVAVTPAPVAAPAPVVAPAPVAPAVAPPPATSTNWAGYVATGTHQSVTVSFVVPSLTSCGPAELSYSEFWAGLGGWGGGSVEQAGVNVECYNGTVYYQPWWEMAPAPMTVVSIPAPILAGDTVTASAADNGNGTYHLSLSDARTGAGFSVNEAPTQGITQDDSAECVAENNAFDNPSATYANYSPVTFTGCTAAGGVPVTTVDNGTTVASEVGPVTDFTVSR